MTTSTPDNPCPFCGLDAKRVRAENTAAVAIADAFPVADGHTLVVPKRHDASIFDLTDGKRIRLKPGAAYSLGAFYELLRDLIQGAWVRFVQKLNANNLGNITDLGTFHLAAERHLAAWAERNRLHQDELQTQLQEAALPCDLSASSQIATWAYEQTERANGQVWVTAKMLQHLGPTWRQCFAA